MDLTAANILKIREPSTLFAGDAAAVKAAFRKLVKVWHPDHNKAPEAVAVFEHITSLRDKALAADKPAAATDTARTFTAADGRKFRLRFLTRHDIEGGEVFVGKTAVAYRIDPEHTDLVENAMGFEPKFADDKMRADIERLLPQFKERVETEQGTLLLYTRTNDQVLLADLIARLGTVDPLHVAWMISAMENVGAYLTWAGLAHGAFDPTMILVSPKFHSVALTGPFLYGTSFGKRPTALPNRSLNAVPRMALPGVAIDARVDLELIRLTAREALGDAGGTNLLHRKDIPQKVAMWLLTPPAENGVADYASWERARDGGFGPRRFVEMKISPPVYAD